MTRFGPTFINQEEKSELKFTVACKSISKKEKKLKQLIYGFCYFERSCHSVEIYANLK